MFDYFETDNKIMSNKFLGYLYLNEYTEPE